MSSWCVGFAENHVSSTLTVETQPAFSYALRAWRPLMTGSLGMAKL
jgi:hypothetical protein